MDFTVLLVALGIIIVLFIVGKIFAILTKIFFVILLTLHHFDIFLQILHFAL